MSNINPNSDKDYIDNLDLSIANNFPKFLKSVEFKPFRHIPDLKVDFQHPISVISGTNRSGKSTMLMALACSHINFNKQDIRNGNIRRHTWRDLMLFTNHDRQNQDWRYSISYKLGSKEITKEGYRKHTTKKWAELALKKDKGILDKGKSYLLIWTEICRFVNSLKR
jgi:predicted ATP-dependent endonuclease of OLD family